MVGCTEPEFGLNPYSNGMKIEFKEGKPEEEKHNVLILILME